MPWAETLLCGHSCETNILKLDNPHFPPENILSPATSLHDNMVQRYFHGGLKVGGNFRKPNCDAHYLSLPPEMKLTGHLNEIIIILSQSKNTSQKSLFPLESN